MDDPDPTGALRPVALPATVPGGLWLTGLPDSDRRLARFLEAVAARGVRQVVVLVEDREIRALAPAYGRLLASPDLPFAPVHLPIPDLGVPEDASGFRHRAAAVAAALQQGERLVVHCRAGIGRTGLMACAVLIKLGLPPDDAAGRVAAAGSGCETADQLAFLRDACGDGAA